MKLLFARYFMIAGLAIVMVGCSGTSKVKQKNHTRQVARDSTAVADTGALQTSAFDGRFRPINVERMLDTLTLQEKVGQLFMVRVSSSFRNNNAWGYQRLLRRVQKGRIGGVMLSNGNPYAAARNIQRLQSSAPAPLLVGADFEWGLPMRMSAGTRFPENMAIGATGNADYAYQQGVITAKEAKAMGVHMNFAPVMDVNNNPDNPIINIRSYGGNPELVSQFGTRYIEGLQSNGVVATIKHFPGHGDTDIDSHLQLPTLPFNRSRLNKLELVPFKAAIKEGAKAVMAGHVAMSEFPYPKRPASLSPVMIDSLLRDSLGYEGVVITDGMTLGGIQEGYWSGEAALKALKAGADIVLLPTDFRLAYQTVLNAVEEGRLSKATINKSVRRVLELKKFVKAGQTLPDFKQMEQTIENRSHVLTANKIYRESLTLVKDKNDIIPLNPAHVDSVLTVIVTDDMQFGYPGDTFVSQMSHYYDYNRVIRIGPHTNRTRRNRALNVAENVDAVVAGVFVRFGSYKGRLNLPDTLSNFMKELLQVKRSVATVGFGTPYLLRYFPEAKTYLTTYSASDKAERVAVQGLIGDQQIAGKLPITLPSGYKFGHGLTRERTSTNWVKEEVPDDFAPVKKLIRRAIDDSVAPGMAVYAARDGKVFMNRGFGHFTYDKDSPEVTSETIFDLASLTKVIATVPMAMQMNEQNLLHLDKPVRDYIPQFRGGQKDSVTIRQLLSHTAGIKPYVRFWKKLEDPTKIPQKIYNMDLAFEPGKEYHYSDPGFILLQQIIEKLGGASLDELAERNFYDPLKMDDTMFKPGPSLRSRIPPTEYDSAYRGRLIRGEVHDENAAFMGGVAGHAGLFSTTGDLGRFAQMLLDNGYVNGRKYFESSTIRTFTEPQLIDTSSTRALGWDTPSEKNSLYGSKTSGEAYGHFGFTGTSILIDPEYRTIVILLTNRVYPTRKNEKINRFRPKFHNKIMKTLLEQKLKGEW